MARCAEAHVIRAGPAALPQVQASVLVAGHDQLLRLQLGAATLREAVTAILRAQQS